MKLLLFLFSFAALASGQTLPTNGLVIQYDMLTTTGGGTTLTDLSGSGNNGTIHGTGTNAQGRTFNGTSDWVNVPVLIGNNDFTAMAVVQPANNGGSGECGNVNAIWSELNAAGTQGVVFTNNPGSNANLISGASSVLGTPTPSCAYVDFPDWDIFEFDRGFSQINYRVMSRQGRLGSNFGTPGTITTGGGGALGGKNTGSSQSQFWTGTIGYFLLYNRGLTLAEMQSAYAFLAAQVYPRALFLPPYFTPSPYTAPVWTRHGYYADPLNNNLGETSVIYDTNPQILTGNTNVFKMWVHNLTAQCVVYAESTNALSWTPFTSWGTCVTPSPTTCQPSVVKVNGVYHGYFAFQTTNLCGNPTRIDHYTSTNGTTWTLAQTGVIVEGATGAWDAGATANPSVLYNPDGSGLWYMTYGGTCSVSCGPYPAGFRTGGATSPDGVTWTKSTANPLYGNVDPPGYSGLNCGSTGSLAFINGNWYTWDSCPAGLFRMTSPTFNDRWTLSQSHFSLTFQGNDLTRFGNNTVIQVGNTSYWFYGKLLTSNLSLSAIVLTNEGTSSDWP